MAFRNAGILSLFISLTMLNISAASIGHSSFHELEVDGVGRSYILYQPKTSGNKELPLMIVLHGGLGNARYMQESTGMDKIADTGPFIVAYPNGVGGRFGLKNRRTWNAGGCCGRATKIKVDDVRFIEKLIEDIDTKFSIDTRRVYVTGMSNGAMMAYRLACEIPDKIAAIVPVAGTLAVGNCDAAKDIPVMHIHGTEDKNVPVAGGKGAMSVAGVAHRSVSDTVMLMTRPRQCQEPTVRTGKDGIQISTYRCTSGASVVTVLINGGEHVWPGGYGNRNQDSTVHHFSASQQAWEFSKQFTKPSK